LTIRSSAPTGFDIPASRQTEAINGAAASASGFVALCNSRSTCRSIGDAAMVNRITSFCRAVFRKSQKMRTVQGLLDLKLLELIEIR
jgi:hypothetical protein